MIDAKLKKEIKLRIELLERPGNRIALSTRYPLLKSPILFTRRFIQNWKNFFNSAIVRKHSEEFFPHIVARHQSVLIRTLGNSDLRLQKNKVINLKLATKKLNGAIIPPGKTFSLWYFVGNPTRRRGYVDGMLLSRGKVIEGVGGGLCQLANFLFWILMHADVEVVERYHHSFDVFPDSGRVLPFGSGATIMYNFVDLKVKNTSKHPLQLKIWVSDKHLKGQILCDTAPAKKFHVYEVNHCFILKNKKYYRYNEIWRDTLVLGRTIKSEKIVTNLAPVLYEMPPHYIEENNFELIRL